MGADHRRTGGARDDLVERRRRGVGEIEDHPEPDELVDERPAQPRQPAVLGSAVGERVAAVPGQPGHAHAELPERLGRPRLVAELLDAFEREHQPDPLAALDRIEVGRRPDLHDPLGALADGTEQAGRLAERLAERALGLPLELDEDRAHLQPDAAGLEQGEPRPGEGARFAEAQLPVAELEQQVEVGVRDHAGSLRASAACGWRASHCEARLATGC